jgi:deoxyribodipyrimidine photolyase-related protein
LRKLFKDHPGSTDNFWLATEFDEVVKLLNFFIKEKSNLFGDYEDAVNQKDNILFHSALSPYINLGLITPEFIIQKVLDFHKKNKIRMNSLRRLHSSGNWLERIYARYLSKLFEKMETKIFLNKIEK